MQKIIDCLNALQIDWVEFERLLVECPVRKNREFNSRIVPTKLNLIGWYIPNLRAIVRGVRAENVLKIIDEMPDNFYEESLLVALLLGRLKDREIVLDRVAKFTQKIDNWSTCDLMCSELKIVRQNKEFFAPFVRESVASESEFVARVGIVLLMKYYLKNVDLEATFAQIKDKNSQFYYVNMALAWLLAEACINSAEFVLENLPKTHFNPQVYTMLAGKVRDSFRVSPEVKEKIKNLCATVIF